MVNVLHSDEPTKPIQAANALFNACWREGEVEVDYPMSELEIQSLLSSAITEEHGGRGSPKKAVDRFEHGCLVRSFDDSKHIGNSFGLKLVRDA